MFDVMERISPDWRGRMVERMLNESTSRKYLTRSLQPLIRRYFQFSVNALRVRERVSDLRDADSLICKLDPECYSVQRLYEHPNQNMRHTIEARILAGQDNQKISQLTSIPPSVIDLYAELYFDVRPRLLARDWICNEVLGQVFQSGDASAQTTLTAKYFAYFGGPDILEAVLYGHNTAQGHYTAAEDIGDWLDSATRFRMRIQNMVAMTTYQPSKYDVTDLMNGYVALLSFELRERDLGGEENVLTQVLEAVKVQNPILLGDAATFTQEAQGLYAEKGVVPRVHERAMLARGQTPPALERYADPEFERRLNGERRKPPSKPDKSKDD